MTSFRAEKCRHLLSAHAAASAGYPLAVLSTVPDPSYIRTCLTLGVLL